MIGFHVMGQNLRDMVLLDGGLFQGRRAEALTQLQTVLSPAEAHYNLGSVYELQGKNDQAAADYRKALELDPQFQDAKSRLTALEAPPTGVSRAE